MDAVAAFRDVLVVLAGEKFELDDEAAKFGEVLPAAVKAALARGEAGLLRAGFVGLPVSILALEFRRDRQVWVVSGKDAASAADVAIERAKRLVASITSWPACRVRVSWLQEQARALPDEVMLDLRCMPGVDVQLHHVHGAANLFGPSEGGGWIPAVSQ